MESPNPIELRGEEAEEEALYQATPENILARKNAEDSKNNLENYLSNTGSWNIWCRSFPLPSGNLDHLVFSDGFCGCFFGHWWLGI
jgi:hypothetical protein